MRYDWEPGWIEATFAVIGLFAFAVIFTHFLEMLP